MDDPIDRRIVIVGAGMAGVACATALGRAGQTVVLFDKGHRPGGRMSTQSIATPLARLMHRDQSAWLADVA